MIISRRSFLACCTASAAALGLSQLDLFQLKVALASPNARKVIWLQGAGCSGCSVSLLDLVQTSDPTVDPNVPIAPTVEALLTDATADGINLIYHPTLMSAAGQTASDFAITSGAAGNFILVVEGGVPTAFGGACGIAWSRNGEDVTFQDAVKMFANSASMVIAVGTCASFGGVPASGDNPAGVVPVSKVVSNTVINVPGCPAHPYWIVWTLANAIAGNDIALDGFNRPTHIYGNEVHANCPRNSLSANTVNPNDVHAQGFGQPDESCLIKLGCAGPGTHAPCPTMKWNNGVSWCVDVNGLCLSCTDPNFPDNGDFYNV